jgi:lipopolysaccharide transport system ATP-binding protein
MYVRLAFAVAVSVEPEILIVDEALAVGDAPFQTKCFARMRELISKGTNVLFVSHDLSSVRAFCDKAIYLKNGILQSYSSAMDVCNLYTMACIEAIGVKTEMMQQVANPISHFLSKDVLASNKSKVHIFSPEFEKQAARNRSGSGLVRIINFYFESMEGQIVKDVAHNLIYNAVFILEAYADFYREIHLAVAIKDLKGTEFLEVRDSHYVEPLQLRAGQRAVAKMQITLPLHAGEYYATIGMLAFCVGDKFKDGTFNFSSAELCDLIEYGYFFSVAPFHKYYIRSPVHQESNLVITYLKKP